MLSLFLWWIDGHEQGSVVAIGGMADAGDGETLSLFYFYYRHVILSRLAHAGEQSAGE